MSREHEEVQVFTRGRAHGEVFVFSQATPRARKDYHCDGCNEQIPRGSRYVSYVTKGEEGPGMERWRLHGECFLEDIEMFTGDRPGWRWKGPSE